MTPITNKIKKISPYIILEGVIIIIIVNFIFSIIYYYIYMNDKQSFKIVNKNNEDDDTIDYFDFFYYTMTSFYRLGYDITPTTKLTKILVVFQLNCSFILSALIIGEIL